MTRWLHFAGRSGAILCLVGAAFLGSAWPAVAAPCVAYGHPWAGHFLVEENAPATFRYPLPSMAADRRRSRPPREC
ncbi:MAG: DUF962 domain-containing protein [Alphaproteobacteria bacterium]